MQKEKILVIGAGGQLGVEFTLELRKISGGSNVIASDLREEKRNRAVYKFGCPE